MITADVGDSRSSRPKWTAVVLAIFLWLCCGPLVGILGAAISGEHGSIVLFFLGVQGGIAGAVAHTALLFAARFRNLSAIRQTLVLWVAAVSLMLLVALASMIYSGEQTKFTAMLSIIAEFVALPALAGSAVLRWLVSRAAA